MLHSVVNHMVEYANGPTHTNTIEGFWSLVKRAWYGSPILSIDKEMLQDALRRKL
jgi:hypothetical protein